jgi:hypothetical protein
MPLAIIGLVCPGARVKYKNIDFRTEADFASYCILKSVHTSTSPIFSYKLYSVATPGHLEPLLLENHVRIIALTPDLQRVSFYSVTDFLYYSSTTELILSLILNKGVLSEL